MRAIRAAHAFDGTTFLSGDATVLIDCHTHLVADATVGGLERAGTMPDGTVDMVITDSLRAHAAAGVTTVRDVVKVMASGGFATPGSDQLGAQFTVDELVTFVDEAHAAGLPVVAHAHSLLGMQNAVAAGVDGIEHFTGLTGEGPRIDDELLDPVAGRRICVDLTMGNDRWFHAQMPEPPPPLAALMARLGIRSFDDVYLSRIPVITRLREHGVAVVRRGLGHGQETIPCLRRRLLHPRSALPSIGLCQAPADLRRTSLLVLLS